jgi:uncharacterized phage protein gp47/JayE
MAFTRPTLKQIIDRIEGDLKTGLSLTTILKKSFLAVMAKALGGASHTLHGAIEDTKDQFFPDTANDTNLLRWANIFGINRLDATFAVLTVDVVGTTGNTLPAGTIVQRADGLQFTVDVETVIGAAATVSVSITASEAGEDYNTSNASTLTFLSPISGIESEVTVTATTTEADDQETIEALRTRVLERIRNVPSGGTVNDYIAFAKVVGVTRVWILPNNEGQGTVGVSFVEDDEDPIIPSAAKVQEVQDAIDLQKPITAQVNVFAPNELQMNPTIQIKPNTAAVQAAVTEELNDLLLREAQVRNAVDPEEVGIGTTFDGVISLSKINEAISIAAGEEDHVVVSPVADVTPLDGGLVTLGTITFQTLV